MASCASYSGPLSSSPPFVALQNPKISSLPSPPQWLNHFVLTLQPKKRIRVRKTPPSPKVFCLHEPRATVVTGNSWDKLVINSEVPVLVEFYASWCGPCRMVHRVIDEIAAEYVGRVKCFMLHADTESEIAENYDVNAVPVVLLFKNGEKCISVVGTMPKEFYLAAIEKVLTS